MSNINQKVKNYGVIEGQRTTDYQADLVAGILPYEEKNPSGDYEFYLPPGEWQKSDNGDSMSCVTFGEINAIETEEKRQTNYQFNYSDRWIAKMSRTTREGNYLWKVADTIRKFGLVLESSYSAPLQYTWEEYHADIPESKLTELLKEGQEWLKKWDFKYEFVDFGKDSLIKHLKHGPIVVVLPGHLVLNFRTSKQVINYFDSYEPFKKQALSVSSAMKIVLTPIEQALDQDHLYVNIKYGDIGSQVKKLKRVLQRLGWFLKDGIEAQDGWDIYNDRIKELVFSFQKANLDWGDNWVIAWKLFVNNRGKEVDEMTREVINSALKLRK